MDLHDHFFAQFCHHPKIVSVVLKGTKLLQSMCLLKPPGKWVGLNDSPHCFLILKLNCFEIFSVRLLE